MQIRVEKLSFGYSSSQNVLDDISCTISAGERVALTGHNGSGKSTLVKHLNGLLRPRSGSTSSSSRTLTSSRRDRCFRPFCSRSRWCC